MQKLKYHILAIITLIGISLMSIAYAEQIYKSVDAQGNVVYSDQPSPNAQPVNPAPISIAPTPNETPLAPVTSTSAPPPGDEVKVYTQLDLISPLNDQTIWDNNGTVNVSIAMSPKLGPGDAIQLVLDGKVVATSNSTTNFTLTGIDRGTHVLQAQIINSKKKTVKTSNVVTFYLHKAIAACNNPLQMCDKGNCQEELSYLADHANCQQIFMDKLAQAEDKYENCKANNCPKLAELKQKYDNTREKIQQQIQAAMLILEDKIEQCKETNCSELGDLRKKYFIAQANIYQFKINQCKRTNCTNINTLKTAYQQAKEQEFKTIN